MARATTTSRLPRPTRAWSVGAYLSCVAVVCVLDQLAKAAAQARLVPGRPVVVLPDVLSLNLVRNEGAAFGILQGQVAAFVACAFVVVAACLAYIVIGRHHTRLEVVSLGLVGAGAVGNVIDRIALGHVVDFIQVTFVRFPVFNVADIAVTCGFVLFLVSLFLNPDDEPPAGGASDDETVTPARRAGAEDGEGAEVPGAGEGAR